MSQQNIEVLLADLKSDNIKVRDEATQALWDKWFWQKGLLGVEKLKQSQTLIDQAKHLEAEQILTSLINVYPDFAEAWNRRAVLHYMNADFEQAIRDCQATVKLVPFHFGALHGLGLCYAARGEIQAAIQAFRKALEIQPHAILNQKLMLECIAQI